MKLNFNVATLYLDNIKKFMFLESLIKILNVVNFLYNSITPFAITNDQNGC